MKIRDIRALPVNIPFRAPYRFSYGSIASLTKTVVILTTEDGVEGLGECADGDRAADVAAMGAALVGHDVRDINAARARLVPAMAYTPWGDVTAAKRVFGGIEMAMWDARGKTEGRSLSALLGGALRSEIPQTEYFSYRLAGPDEPGEASPSDVARYCEQMLADHGAQVFEGKVGTVSLAEEIEMVRAVRDAIGDRELRLDANGTWSLPTARRALAKLAAFDIAWFEEPCESYEEMAALRAHVPMSFSSHRIDLPKAVALGAPDAIVTNVNEHGGIAGTVAFIAACAEMGVGFRFHSGETGIASAAYLHLTAALGHVHGISQTLLRWYADDVIEGGPHALKNGVTPLPDGPGLGVVLDPKALVRCHRRFLDEGAFPSGGKAAGYGTDFRKS
ncbi:mandelate racemase/muconate lactonizing enzyme family protein [Sulfitobacter sp. D35]|uniref:mandelate racemase/muconate lactonizing enzyme family protein n=1 Tax=Sulfitobacter sp. D35 TaxID=3083252 RepID=UPI00296F5910|nr:mandelate racemase/muconate lactonizing enzyme family protein [Sulfitobacter sp. D35]MDW4499371.1 mandelate racemase/muconate lactonizing enzyme family protein [Sulfitobacter sp. D35]